MADVREQAIAPLPVGADGDHITYCRLCEACCGLVARVEDGRITSLTPDKDNPHSQGHVCVKGVQFVGITYDPDRVLTPLKRVGGPGEFAPVSWEEALSDIAARIGAIREAHGADAFAAYIGNPASFAANTATAHSRFMRALGVRKSFNPGTQDNNARSVANFLAFGAVARSSFPDLPRCDFLLMLGANPLVSNGSLMFAPRVRHDLDAIAARGRVIVIDPRVTETARRYEHLPIRPQGDVWLLIGLLRTLFDEKLIDRAAVAVQANGLEDLEAAICAIDVETAAARAGVAADIVRDLARQFAAAPRAAAYGRVGLCRGPFSTLANFLLTALNLVAGKCGKPGGDVFGYTALAGGERTKPGGYSVAKSRFGDVPSVIRDTPSALLAAEINEPGAGQVRALFCTAGNPLLSAPGGEALERGLAGLELLVAFDFYVNETGRYAHYVLPTPTFLERPDFPYVAMGGLMRPFIQYTEAVVPPCGEARHEHEVYREIIERLGLGWPGQGNETPGEQPRTPLEAYDDLLRRGPIGDQFGEREGWSFARLREHPHGVMLKDMGDSADRWSERIAYADRKALIWHPSIAEEWRRLLAAGEAAPDLALIGRRDIRSMNSWMHNVDRLVRSQHALLQIHPTDAEARQIRAGDKVRVFNENGALELMAEITDEVSPGTLCYPHGWGHDGGWRLANQTPGRNINMLIARGVAAIDQLSGASFMDGVPVSIERVAPAAA